jgi:tRNA nucleotidyltransferase (CCA-adding enzyme)
MITNFNKYKTKMNIPQDIYIFNSLFKEHDKELYIVGGAVRDFLMDIQPHDFDLVTNAKPDEIVDILKDYRTDLQGKHFGVIRVFTKDCKEGYEIASYRKDISKGRDTKGTDKKVQLDDVSLKDDLQRRDITINALVYDIDKHNIIDLVNGVNDLDNKIISTVGEAEKRFDEDRLRILRTIRFACRYGFTLDQKTEDAILKDHRLFGISAIDDVSQERIIEEIYKMYDYAKKRNDYVILNNYFKMLIKYDILQFIFKKLILNYAIINNSLDLTVILTSILCNNNTSNLLDYLIQEIKLSHEVSNEIVFLIKLQNLTFENFYELKKLENRINISSSTILEYFQKSNQLKNIIHKFINFKFTISGNELIDKGFKGREIGDEMKRIEIKKFKNFVNEK